MAKGLRSKSARKNRAIKRESVFGAADKARMERLAERLKKDHEGPKLSELEAAAAGNADEMMEANKSADVDMDDDKKISTSGRKDSGNQRSKLAKHDKKKMGKKVKGKDLKKKTFFHFHK
ncbi:hypothetical protein DFQ27_009362 [Actinomortierella ambigua]|uniref:DUF2423 domain-containing protein n=1 Tax=Actinomortierella ambigua TaxID=1343610 RepID=A0A9P6QGY0_9FUNG|nr:hypothetical protein DFQ26_005939 [Actinomortierella ambigua]KAG0266895.1 hypothetical protein DFQ27_009362 [Actinomortierella ambigua]